MATPEDSSLEARAAEELAPNRAALATEVALGVVAPLDAWVCHQVVVLVAENDVLQAAQETRDDQ